MSKKLIKDELSIKEVAELIGLSKSRTGVLIQCGRIRKIETGKRQVRVTVAEVERYLASYHAKRPFTIN